jgi:outer membrane protein TolC
MPHRLIVVSFLLIFSLFGCVKYKKAPLVPSEVLQEIEVIRNKDEKFANNSLTFDLVAKVMSENSLQLKLIRTKYESVCKVAKIKTPWFNPSIEFGPDFGTSLASQVSNKVAPFVGLGFTIPLGGKLKKNNNLNSAKALRALLEVQAQHRELYLSLRETYTLFYLALKKKKINQEVTVGSQLTLKIVKSLANVGSVDILEVGLTELEVSKMSLKNLEIQQDIEKLRSELIIIIGFDIKSLSQESQVVLPTPEEIKLPVKDEIKLILVENHLGLARLRLDYEVAEKELCLEISKQYPNIQLGGG